MAGERCNLGKDEAELLKPSSPSSTPPPNPSQTAPTNPPSLFLSPPQEILSQLTEKSETNHSASVPVATKPIRSDRPKIIRRGSAKPSIESTKSINRCLTCSKRVGLMGFRCRCGELFCGQHRYSETHDCSFDYKTSGRAEIMKNNPLVRAAKIIKI